MSATINTTNYFMRIQTFEYTLQSRDMRKRVARCHHRTETFYFHASDIGQVSVHFFGTNRFQSTARSSLGRFYWFCVVRQKSIGQFNTAHGRSRVNNNNKKYSRSKRIIEHVIRAVLPSTDDYCFDFTFILSFNSLHGKLLVAVHCLFILYRLSV